MVMPTATLPGGGWGLVAFGLFGLRRACAAYSYGGDRSSGQCLTGRPDNGSMPNANRSL